MLGEIKKSLTEIVEGNKIVLIDSCIDKPFIISNTISMLYDCKDLFALNAEQREAVFYETEHMGFIIELINSHNNIFTIPEVAGEIGDKNKIIGEIYRYNNDKRDRKLRRGLDKCGSNISDIKEYLDMTYHLSKTLKGIEKRPDHNTFFLYNSILNNIKILNKTIGIIKKEDEYFPYPRKKQKTINSDTDEKLAAMVFYLSITDETDVALVTNDGDFKRLIGTSYSLFRAKDLGLPENSIFRRMEKYSPKIYSKLNTGACMGYKLFFDAKWAIIAEQFRIFNRPDESDSIKKSFLSNMMEADRQADSAR